MTKWTQSTCPHGYFYSTSTYRAYDDCTTEFPEEPEAEPLSDVRLRAIEEMARELTTGMHTAHGPGELDVRQYPQFGASEFVLNTSNEKVLWESHWAAGPATEAMALLPWASRMLIAEVKRLRSEADRLSPYESFELEWFASSQLERSAQELGDELYAKMQVPEFKSILDTAFKHKFDPLCPYCHEALTGVTCIPCGR